MRKNFKQTSGGFVNAAPHAGQGAANQWLNVKEAAALLGVTPQFIRLAARAGKIKGYHPFAGCAKYVFKADELKAGMTPAEEL